ncbi:MAG: head GIN domain-containing protein [Lentimicrobium sp.]|jgi:hypothetical protein|nr:head GIN domain-containing protein [Lentimicrobium sp.]
MKLNAASTKSMMRALLALSLIAAISLDAFSATQERQVGRFNEIDVSGPFLITLVQNHADAGKIIIRGSQQDIDRVITNVRDQELNISLHGKSLRVQNIEITIYFTDLKSIEMNGATQLKANSSLKFNALSLECSGSCSIDLELTADKLKLETSGKSSVSLSGKAGNLEVEFSGASEFAGENLVVNQADIECSGASIMQVHVVETMSIEASGSSVIKFSGNPRILKQEITGKSVLTQL